MAHAETVRSGGSDIPPDHHATMGLARTVLLSDICDPKEVQKGEGGVLIVPTPWGRVTLKPHPTRFADYHGQKKDDPTYVRDGDTLYTVTLAHGMGDALRGHEASVRGKELTDLAKLRDGQRRLLSRILDEQLHMADARSQADPDKAHKHHSPANDNVKKAAAA